jgi:hypothetical protein
LIDSKINLFYNDTFFYTHFGETPCKSSNPQILKSSKSSVRTFTRLSSALLLVTQTGFAAITAGKPSDISPNYFTVVANGANCDIVGSSNAGVGIGNGTQVGSSTTSCSTAAAPSTWSITKPTTFLNVGVLYFKQVAGAGTWKRYPGWFTLDSSCAASNFYYDNVLDATIIIGQTGSTIVSAPIDLKMNKPVETYSTEIELK